MRRLLLLCVALALVSLAAVPRAEAVQYSINITPSDDTVVNQVNPNTNFGTAVYLVTRNQSALQLHRIYTILKFPTTTIPTWSVPSSIFQSTLCLYQYYNLNVGSQKVFDVYGNQYWNEYEITWNTGNPCGKELDNSTACDLTSAIYYTQKNGPSVWDCINVTDFIISNVNSGNQNISIELVGQEFGEQVEWDSKENGTHVPFLNVSWATGVGFCANDSSTQTNIPAFNVSIYNSTYTKTETDIACGYSEDIANLPLGPVTIIYTAAGYIPSSYSYLITTSTNYNSFAPLLPSSLASMVRFHVYSGTGQAIAGAQVNATIIIGSYQALAGTLLTDATGTAAFGLSATNQYNISIAVSGYTPYSFLITPTQSDYSITLSTQSYTVTGPTWADVLWTVSPSGGTYSNDTTIYVTWDYADTDQITTSWGWTAYYDGTVINTSTYGSQSGTIVFNISTASRPGNVTLYTWAARSGLGTRTANYTYYITSYSIGQPNGSMCSWIQASSLGAQTLNIMGALVIVFVMSAFSRLPWHVAGAGGVGLVVLGLMMWTCVMTIGVGIYIGLWLIYLGSLYLMRGF